MDSQCAQNVLLTLGQVAQRLGTSMHRVKYAIDQYHIEPLTRVGIIRVWSADDVRRIADALDRINHHRQGGR